MKWNNGIQEYQRWKGENPIQRYCIYFIYVCVCVCVNLIVIQDSLLEKEMATHSSIPAWEIPWTKEPCEPTVHRVAKSWTGLSN